MLAYEDEAACSRIGQRWSFEAGNDRKAVENKQTARGQVSTRNDQERTSE